MGDYLDNPVHLPNLKYILGDEITESKKQILNERLRRRIQSCVIKPEKVFIHYSNKEPTYRKHIKYLLADLAGVGIELSEDVASYTDHGEVGDSYPPYLCKILNEIMMK